ncbi:MAG: DUF3196 family protein [Mycoplasmoidaceae bacterium]|nr:DUF3196 family protein [Mycoplasmoidaceae bacterium]
MKNNLEKLLKQTEKLIKSERENEALSLLESNLNDPLFSLKEQEEIKAKIDLLKKFISQNKWALELNKADKNSLIKIFNTNGYEITVLDKIFERFATQLTKTDLLKLGQVLLDDSIPNEAKITYLNIFKDYEVKHVFDYHNTNTGRDFKVDTGKDFSISNFEKLFFVQDKLSALFFKETSKEQLSNQIVNAIYYYYFDDYAQIKYSKDELFDKIANYVERAFNSIYPEDKKFSEWITKILA